MRTLRPENGVHVNWATVTSGGCHFTVMGLFGEVAGRLIVNATTRGGLEQSERASSEGRWLDRQPLAGSSRTNLNLSIPLHWEN
jgi:hypothetical protein